MTLSAIQKGRSERGLAVAEVGGAAAFELLSFAG